MAKITLNTCLSFAGFAEAATPSKAERFLKDAGLPYEKKTNGTFLVKGDIDLSGRGLTALPDLSAILLTGNFMCHDNKLASLKGAPRAVTGFWCYNNELTTLQGAPAEIAHHFFCGNNRLTSLEGGPLCLTGSYHCGGNRLVTLEGGPQQVGETFFCGDNKLSSLEAAPLAKMITSDFGDFTCWEEVPEHLRVSEKTKERLAQEKEDEKTRRLAAVVQGATILGEPVAVSKPFRFKTVKPTI